MSSNQPLLESIQTYNSLVRLYTVPSSRLHYLVSYRRSSHCGHCPQRARHGSFSPFELVLFLYTYIDRDYHHELSGWSSTWSKLSTNHLESIQTYNSLVRLYTVPSSRLHYLVSYRRSSHCGHCPQRARHGSFSPFELVLFLYTDTRGGC